MIIGTVTVTRSMVLAALAAAALLLAFVGIFAAFGVGIRTPGFWRSGFLFPEALFFYPPFSTRSADRSDWLFWFALMLRFIFR